MSDLAPWTAKIDDETRAKLTDLQRQLGGTANEMLQRLTEAYDLQTVCDTLADAPELRQLRHHLKRSEEIFVEIVKCSRDREVENGSRIAELDAGLRDSRLAAQEANEKLDRALKESEEAINEIGQSLSREKESREEAVRIQLTLQRALDIANARAAELEDKANQTDRALADLHECESRLGAAERRVQDQEARLAKAAQLQEEASALKKERDQLQRAVERFPVEKREAELAIERRMLDEFYKLRDELASAREQSARLELDKEREIGALREELRRARETTGKVDKHVPALRS